MSGRDRLAPWIEGALGAALVLVLYLVAGEAVRASYHGYLHTAIGEAVLRDGLLPENPYHAAHDIQRGDLRPLRYYTLYPLLGVGLGRLGFGPIWAFALLNVLAALLFAPALDALGRSLGLGFRARRAAFLAAVIGFNGLGWLGAITGDAAAAGAPPVYALMPLTFAAEPWGWDARLQAFLVKYLNVSSFALALPFALWALASTPPAAEPGATPSGRPLRAGLTAALALAINPLVGGVAGLVLALWIAPTFVRGPGRARLAWLGAGALALVAALPFVAGALFPAPSGRSLIGQPALGGSPWSNLIGPLVVLAPLGLLGLGALRPGARWRIAGAALVCALGVLFAHLPHGNEYKLERLGALFWALAAGAWAAAGVGRVRSTLAWLVLAACVPTSVLTARAYLRWGEAAQPLPLANAGGRLVSRTLSTEILAAEAHANPHAVLVVALDQRGSRAAPGLVQGNALAACVTHALFVDLPQIHNDRFPDLERRLELVQALWSDASPADRLEAITQVRGELPRRPLLVLTARADQGLEQALRAFDATELATDPDGVDGHSLWWFPRLIAEPTDGGR